MNANGGRKQAHKSYLFPHWSNACPGPDWVSPISPCVLSLPLALFSMARAAPTLPVHTLSAECQGLYPVAEKDRVRNHTLRQEGPSRGPQKDCSLPWEDKELWCPTVLFIWKEHGEESILVSWPAGSSYWVGGRSFYGMVLLCILRDAGCNDQKDLAKLIKGTLDVGLAPWKRDWYKPDSPVQRKGATGSWQQPQA